MNQMPQNPLANLKDIHLPPDPGWWPPAYGWWLIAILLLTITYFGLNRWRRRQARLRPIKLALKELKELNLEINDPDQRRQLLQEISALVRRFSLIFFPETEVAELCGREWLDFICKNSSLADTSTRKAFSPLIQAPYAPICDTDLVALGKNLEQWFRDQSSRKRKKAKAENLKDKSQSDKASGERS